MTKLTVRWRARAGGGWTARVVMQEVLFTSSSRFIERALFEAIKRYGRFGSTAGGSIEVSGGPVGVGLCHAAGAAGWARLRSYVANWRGFWAFLCI